MTRVASALLLLLLPILDARAGPSAQPQPPGSPRVKDEALRQELLRREIADQADDDGSAAWLRGEDVRHKNKTWLEQVLAEHGWPGHSLVGSDGTRAAWLIAQHADFDVPFQQRCLDLIKDALRWKEVDAWQVAYLTDRVLDNQRQPQMYGTQGAGPASPEEERRIDANRKALGLEPWKVFIANGRQARSPLAAVGHPDPVQHPPRD